MVALVTDAKKSDLPTLTEVGVAVFGAALTPSVSAGSVGSLTGEISTGDAAGYTRVDPLAVEWDALARRLMVDDAMPTFDLEGAPSVAYVVTYDPNDGDQVISVIPFAEAAGFDGWEAVLNGGVAGWDDGWAIRDLLANHSDRLTALEANPGGGSGGDGPDAPTTWFSTASHYVDRDRAYLDGDAMVSSGDSATVSLPTLSAPFRPPTNRRFVVSVVDDALGTPALVSGSLVIDAGGTASVNGETPFTGTIQVLFGVSYRLTDPT